MTGKKLYRLSRSFIGDEEKSAVQDVLNSDYFGMGEQVQRFETELAAYLGRPAACVVNGTSALQIALQAADIGPGDEVLVQSLTYVASFQAIAASGALPVACDVSRDSLTINVDSMAANLTPRTKAVMPVHYSGGVGALSEIYDFARENNLRVIEDAAHAFGTSYQGQLIGSFGDITCFSFDGIKNITSGEGGCITSSDEKVMERIRNIRLLGVLNDTDNRFHNKRSWDFDVIELGWRYHMSDIMAAIGREQLKKRSNLANKRRQLARCYDVLFSTSESINIIAHDYDAVVPHVYTVRINGLQDRDELRRRLLAKGVQTGTHYKPNHLLSLFLDSKRGSLEVTESVWPELITLPLHPALDEEDISIIASILLEELDQ